MVKPTGLNASTTSHFTANANVVFPLLGKAPKQVLTIVAGLVAHSALGAMRTSDL